MTSFTDDEIAFMNAQPLARIATVSADGQPDVVPVGFEFDGTYINVGGSTRPPPDDTTTS